MVNVSPTNFYSNVELYSVMRSVASVAPVSVDAENVNVLEAACGSRRMIHTLEAELDPVASATGETIVPPPLGVMVRPPAALNPDVVHASRYSPPELAGKETVLPVAVAPSILLDTVGTPKGVVVLMPDVAFSRNDRAPSVLMPETFGFFNSIS